MSSIISILSMNNVKLENSFTYTISIGFSDIQGSITSAKLETFIPEFLDFTLPAIIGPIKSITESEVIGGKNILFDFGSIEDLGVSISFSLQCKFKLGTDSNTSYINNLNLYINNSLIESVDSEAVTLILEEDFIIEETIAVPISQQSAPGGRVIYTIVLRNNLKSQGGNGDLGAKINNVVISDNLPSGLTLDTNFPVKGNDISNNSYSDLRYENKLAQINGNNFIFSLDNYYGTKYRIVFICNVNADVELDSEIVNTVTLNINSQYRDTSSKTLDIGNASYGAYINNYGPNHGKIGNSASFEITVGNYGNQDLIPVSIVNNIPDEVDIYRVATGSWMIDVIHVLIPQAYSIEYEINNSGTFVLLGNYNTSNSVYANMPILQVNEKITKLRWNIANFPVGTISEKPIIIDGIINTQSTENEFLNVSSITWTDGTGESSVQAVHRTLEDDKSELNIKKIVLNGVTTVVPYQIIRYKISFNGYGSQVNNPIISDLLSEKIEYIGNEKYTYYDYFSNTTINSNDSNFYDEVPINLEIINNFNDSINTLIRYDMDGFSLRQKGNFSVEFDVRVKPGATGNIINNATLGNKGNNGVVAGGYASYLDIDDRDGDGITNESLARSNNISNSIAYYAYLLSDKKVKGELNDYFIEEPLVGKTYQGGKVSYKIVIQNLGNLNFEYIEVVDILPHIGDKGVILENESRNSQFNIYNIKGVTAKIIEDDEVIKETKCKVEYSKSYNPIRFSKNDFGNTTIGADNDWTETAPIVISDIKSIKISTLDVILLPNQLIEIDITCLAPVGVNQNLVAWNSFAVKCSYRNENGILTQMIPVEPENVGVEILNSNKASIGGFTWLDKNKDGYFNNGDIRENGIIVQLLNENNILLNETMTVNNENNLEGYYIFNNIELGNYYIKFIRPNNFYFTKKVDNGDSSADIATGITDIINIQSLAQHIDNINCGFINQISISDLLIELLNYDIYSLNCETRENMIMSINKSIYSFISILNLIEEVVINDLNSNTIDDMGYKAQLERVIYNIINIKTKLKSLNIPNTYCNDNILANILYILIDYIVSILILGSDYVGIKTYYHKCKCIGDDFYEFAMGRFINDISKFENITNQLQNILVVLYSDLNPINKSYIATYVPRNYR